MGKDIQNDCGVANSPSMIKKSCADIGNTRRNFVAYVPERTTVRSMSWIRQQASISCLWLGLTNALSVSTNINNSAIILPFHDPSHSPSVSVLFTFSQEKELNLRAERVGL